MGIEFESVTLGQITKRGGGFIQTGPFGSQLHASDYVPTGVPCIMPANIVDGTVDLADIAYISHADAQRLSKHIVKAGDIVYSRRGDVTRKALIRKHEEGMFCGTGCLLVRPGKYIDPRYLAYHLSSPWNHEWIIRHAIGATMPNLNTSILGDIPLKIPDLENQKNIARVLGVFDEKLEPDSVTYNPTHTSTTL
jgi:type I restriction enzyme S subunit